MAALYDAIVYMHSVSSFVFVFLRLRVFMYTCVFVFIYMYMCVFCVSVVVDPTAATSRRRSCTRSMFDVWVKRAREVLHTSYRGWVGV